MKNECTVITVHCTSWWSLRDDIELNEAFKAAHLLLIQEAKLEEREFPAVEEWCRKRGWAFAAAPCLYGSKQGRSAGVALLWRPNMHRISNPAIILKGRCMAIGFELKFGPTFAATYYGTAGCKASRVREMAKMMDWVGEQQWPVIVGGDLNDGCIETAQLTHPSLSVASPGADERTCIGHESATTIEYFLVANRLMPAVAAVSTEAGIATHQQVVLQLS
jgi:hypothetical protein